MTEMTPACSPTAGQLRNASEYERSNTIDVWRKTPMASDLFRNARPRKKIRGVAFDGFDTLVRIRSNLRTFQRLCHHAGTNFSAVPMTEYVTLHGFAASLGVKDQQLLSSLEDDLAVEISSIEPFDDALSILRVLRQRGLVLGLASNATGQHADRLTELFHDYVDWVQVSCRVGVAKPSFSFFEMLSATMSLPPEEILFVGDDAELDVQAAMSCCMHAIQVVRSQRQPVLHSELGWTSVGNLSVIVKLLDAPL